MTETSTQEDSFDSFTQDALDAVPSLGNPTKINLSFIVQAYKLRKKLSWSVFVAFILLFFWISVVGLILFSGVYGAFGPQLMKWFSGSSHTVSPMVISFASLLGMWCSFTLVSLFGIGYVWRFHVGKKKRFVAALPSFSLFFKIFWPLLFCNIVFTAIYLALGLLVNIGIVMAYMYFAAGKFTSEASNFMSIGMQTFAIIEAICYLLIQALVLYVLFKRYKQDKSGEDIIPFFRSFYGSFKPFFKQSLRFLVTVACFYLIVLLPALVIKPLFSGMSVDFIKKAMLLLSLFYLVFTPRIMTTFFNLFFLLFNSIENYKSGSKPTLEPLSSQKAEPEAKVKPKKPKSKPSKAINKKPAGSTSTPPKTVAKKKPASKVHAKLKSGSSSKK